MEGIGGGLVTLQLGHKYSQFVPAVHTHTIINLDFFDTPPPSEEDFDENEKKYYFKNQEFWEEGHGYFQIQATKPQTLSYAMMDSPVGVAAWIIEKMRGWSDIKNGDIESVYSKDILLSNIMVYLVTKTHYYFKT